MDEITPVRPSTPPAAVVIAPDTVIDFKNGGAVPQPVSALGKAKQKPLTPSLYTQSTPAPKDTPAAVSDVLRPGDPGTHLKGRGSCFSGTLGCVGGGAAFTGIVAAAVALSSGGAALSNTVGQAIMQAAGHSGYDIRSGALDGLVGGAILASLNSGVVALTIGVVALTIGVETLRADVEARSTEGSGAIFAIVFSAAAGALGNVVRASQTDVAISAGASAIGGAVGSAVFVGAGAAVGIGFLCCAAGAVYATDNLDRIV